MNNELAQKAAAETTSAITSFNPGEYFSSLAQGAAIQVYQRNQLVFTQGEPCEAIYFVRDGALKLTITSDRTRRRATIAVLGAGDLIGETCLHGPDKYKATARALCDTTVVKVGRDTMIRLLREHPSVSEFFVKYLLNRHIRMQDDLVDHIFNSSEKRLARTLLLLAGYGEKPEPERVVYNISQETLAEIVGTTRSRVNVFMNKFRKLGLIEYNHGLHVRRSLMDFVQQSKS